MSRIGKLPIPLAAKVEAALADGTITVKGPLGEISRKLHPAVEAVIEEGRIVIRPRELNRESRALWGLTRSLVANMVAGVAAGFKKELEIVGVGYKAEMQGAALKLSLGYSRPRVYEPPPGITLEAPAPQAIVVKGVDKELVGHCAAQIRAQRPPEPYKGKGIRYKGERVRRKVRKGALAGGAG